MIPLKDMTPRRNLPIITILLIVANVVVFIHQISLSPAVAEAFVRAYALTPSKIQMALAGRHYTLGQAWFTARIPAVVFIGLWFLAQFLSGIGSLGAPAEASAGGVAWWAHIGGFLLGVFLARGARGRPAAIYS